MRTFSLIGMGPQPPQMAVAGSVGSHKPAGYFGPRRVQQPTTLRKQEFGRTRFKGQSQPPLRSIAVLAREKDNELFRFISGKSGITPQTSPAEAVGAIKRDVIEVGLAVRGARVHRCTNTAVIIRLTLKTSAGCSRFEGTPAQLLSTFKPLAPVVTA